MEELATGVLPENVPPVASLSTGGTFSVNLAKIGPSNRDPGLKPWSPPSESPLATEWIAWLCSYAWNYFLTITFRDLVPMSRQESVLHAVGETITHNFVTERLFLVSEAHKQQTLHLHGLMGTGNHERPELSELRMSVLWQVLFDTFGRSKVEAPRDSADVARYATKYCLKSGGYYQVFGPSNGKGDRVEKATDLGFQTAFLDPVAIYPVELEPQNSPIIDPRQMTFPLNL